MKMDKGNKTSISIIIPVLNEAGTINNLIAHLRGLHHTSGFEIIVVDGDVPGNTIKTIRDRGVITARAAKGRANQMNRGAALSSGQVLLFLHADTFLPANALNRIEAVMEDGRHEAGAFDLGINSNRWIFRITEWYVALRTRMTRIPFGDQAIFIRRGYFEKIGGYRDIPLMEDVELMKRIRKRGDSIRLIPDKVMSSSRRWEREGVLYATFRNWAFQILYALGMPPERLAKWYKQGHCD